jgi:hypothetical protein
VHPSLAFGREKKVWFAESHGGGGGREGGRGGRQGQQPRRMLKPPTQKQGRGREGGQALPPLEIK